MTAFFDDFPKISNHFAKISEDFWRLIFQNCSEDFPRISKNFTDSWGRPEDVSMKHQQF